MHYAMPARISTIILLCLIIYLPSLTNGFIWDDDDYLYENPSVQASNGLKTIWFTPTTPQYYPLVFTSFWLEHKLWALNPFGYHLVNLLLHILNALLVFALVRRLYPRLAFAVALLFAVHPIQVETVAWITERKNLLGLFFFLLTFLSYLRFERTRRPKDYALALVLFGCALLSKSIAVCFAAVPILYKWWRDDRLSRRQILISLPFAAIGIASAVNTIYLELYRVGASWDTWTLAPLQRFILSGRILVFYVYKLCLPFESIFFYPRWHIDTAQWWQWLFTLASLALIVILWLLRRRIGRGGFSLFVFYIISIFPALGFITVYPMKYSFVADHFSYLSTPCLLLLLCAGIALAFDALKRRFRIFAYVLFCLAIAFLCFKSMALTKSYKDELTLWQDTVKKNPQAWMAYNNLGGAYKRKGDTARALAAYGKATEIKPDYAKAYYNIGNLYQAVRMPEKAIALYKKTLTINPGFIEAYNNISTVYYDLGRYAEAIAAAKKAIELHPAHAKAYNNLGLAYKATGRSEEAASLFKKTIDLRPDYPQAYNNLAIAYRDMGRLNEAARLFKRATELDPGYAIAHHNLAATEYILGNKDKAITLFKKAIALDPDYAQGYLSLALVCFDQKQYALAVEYCDQAKKRGLTNPALLEALEPYRD
ncbi:tetratricopeptide repeat protein [Candidatus Omnitrophota bacterium]